MSNADLVTLEPNVKPLVMLVAKLQARTKGVQEINNLDNNDMAATRILPGTPARPAVTKPIQYEGLFHEFYSPKKNLKEFGAADGMTATRIIPDNLACLIPKNEIMGSKAKSSQKSPSYLLELDRKLQVEDGMTDAQIIPTSPTFLIPKNAARCRISESKAIVPNNLPSYLSEAAKRKFQSADNMTETKISSGFTAVVAPKKLMVGGLSVYGTKPERPDSSKGVNLDNQSPQTERGLKKVLGLTTRGVPSDSNGFIDPKITAADKI